MKLDTHALQAVISDGGVETLATLLDDDPHLIDARNEQGVSYLMVCLYHQKPDHAQVFVERRKQFDLFEAAALGLHEAALNHLQTMDVNAYAPDGFTPLMLACFFARPAMVRLLLDQGANPNQIAQNGAKMTALHSAAAARSLPVIVALLDANADVNVQQQGGYTPLMSVAAHGERALVKQLLSAGADPAIVDDQGQSALDMAAANGHAAVVSLMTRPS